LSGVVSLSFSLPVAPFPLDLSSCPEIYTVCLPSIVNPETSTLNYSLLLSNTPSLHLSTLVQPHSHTATAIPSQPWQRVISTSSITTRPRRFGPS
jgi:hypothetical protein